MDSCCGLHVCAPGALLNGIAALEKRPQSSPGPATGAQLPRHPDLGPPAFRAASNRAHCVKAPSLWSLPRQPGGPTQLPLVSQGQENMASDTGKGLSESYTLGLVPVRQGSCQGLRAPLNCTGSCPHGVCKMGQVWLNIQDNTGMGPQEGASPLLPQPRQRV